MYDKIDNLSSKINLPPNVEAELMDEVKKIIDKCGLFYRSFSRVKTIESVNKKLQNPKYCKTKKLQDLLGVRLVMYFKDDVELCRKIIEKGFEIDNVSEDKNNEETFKPTRLNIVCKIPQKILNLIDNTIFEDFFIDNTFEIQLRTVFSEGWHEVEHDLRYKFSDEWAGDFLDYSRALNGIFATLETCDRAILDLFENFSYAKYKNNSWDAMIRNKLRIRLSTERLTSELEKILDGDQKIAKSILTIDRNDLLEKLSFNLIGKIPKNINNLIYIINTLYVNNNEISKLTPSLILEYCHKKR